MSGLAEFFVSQILVTALLVAVSCLLLTVLFRWLPIVSHKTRALAWAIVLAQGALLFVVNVQLPCLKQEQSAQSAYQVRIVEGLGEAGSPALAGSVLRASVQQESAKYIVWSGLFVWLSGLFYFAVRPWVKYRKLLQCVRALPVAEDGLTSQLQASISRDLGGSSRLQYCCLVFSNDSGPFVCTAWKRNYIVLPKRLWHRLGIERQQAILRHEFAHVVRRDPLKLAVARLLLAVQWFNPFAWLACKRFAESIELGCDHQAMGESDVQRLAYTRALLSLVEARAGTVNALAMAGADGRQLHYRINQVLKPKGNEMKLTRMFVLTLLFFVAMTGVLRVSLVAQESQESAAGIANAIDELPKPGNKLIAKTYAVADLVLEPYFTETDSVQSGVTDADFQELVDLIRQTIDPDSWESAGRSSRIAPFPAKLSLIVTQTKQNHARIQDLLARLRELGTITIAMDAELVVFSGSDLKDCPVDMNGKTASVIRGKEARQLVTHAIMGKASQRFSLPNVEFFNGQAVTYPVHKDSSTHVRSNFFKAGEVLSTVGPDPADRTNLSTGMSRYPVKGGVDFTNIRIQGVKSINEDSVRLCGGKLIKRAKSEDVDPQDEKVFAQWVAYVPEGGFVVVDVSNNMLEPEDGKKAFLIMHVEIHKWN